MTYRHLALVAPLLVVGCADARLGLSEDAGISEDGETPVGREDAGSDPEDDGSVACAAGCAEPEPYCDETTGGCVECGSDADCADDRPYCVENYCVACAAEDEACGEADLDGGVPPQDGGMSPGDEDPPPPSTSFRIRFASYNVRTSNLNNSAWGDTHTGWDSNDEARMFRVADEIAAQNLTVVATQEMRRPERTAVLQRLQNRHGQDWGATTQTNGRDDTMVLFLKSRWRKIRETHFTIRMQGSLRDRDQIGVLLEHRATGQRVWFYSVHFAAGSGDGAPAAREDAARRTVQSIRNRAVANDLPFVLGGDFNTTAASPVGSVFRSSGFMKYTRNAATTVVNNGCRTFNTRAGSAGRQSCPGGTAAHIDHVWVSRSGMMVERYKVTATQRTSRASDHNPVTTILRRP